jgi:1-acyl-sn-glycerol-3-phosphate acyltransferase
MNRYPMVFAPRSWSPALNPWAVGCLRPLRKRQIEREVKLHRIDVQGIEHLRTALDHGQQVMIAPNHPSHADPFAIYEACEQANTLCHIMAAWHVFAKNSALMRMCLQWHGCFSIDRESNDLTAFRDAVTVLRNRPEPLVIFPEGDIYHCNDRVTPFREGAAAIAIAAARRSERRAVVIPTAIRYRCVDDPTPHIEQTLSLLEQRILWRPRPGLPIVERIRAIGEAVLGLKELEFYGRSLHGPLPERIQRLTEFILSKLEAAHQLEPLESVPRRVKQLRQTVLTKLHDQRTPPESRIELRRHLDEAFVVLQLFSYPGDYLDMDSPPIERIAETIDKLEEDVLQTKTASIRCRRSATIEFGEALEVPTTKSRDATSRLTEAIESSVRELIMKSGHHAGSQTPPDQSSMRIA